MPIRPDGPNSSSSNTQPRRHCAADGCWRSRAARGTGLKIVSQTASAITATDSVEEVLNVARRKTFPLPGDPAPGERLHAAISTTGFLMADWRTSGSHIYQGAWG